MELKNLYFFAAKIIESLRKNISILYVNINSKEINGKYWYQNFTCEFNVGKIASRLTYEIIKTKYSEIFKNKKLIMHFNGKQKGKLKKKKHNNN